MSRTASNSLALLPLAQMPPLSRLLVATALVLTRWDERRRSRRALEHLSEHQLQDIGMIPSVAMREISKPFWSA